MRAFISTTILSFCFTLLTFAQSNLIVYSNDGVKFILEVNGIQQNNHPLSNVKVEGINQNYVSVRLLFNDDKTSPVKKNLTLNPDMEISTRLVLNSKGQYKLRWMGEVPIASAPASSNSQTVITYGEEPVSVSETERITPASPATHNTTTTTTSTTTTTHSNAPDGNVESVNMNVNIGGNSFGISASGTGTTNNSSTYSETTTTVTTTTSSNNTSSTTSSVPVESVSNGPCDYPMSSSDFDDAMSSIKSKSFEDSKLTLAKQITKNNCLTANQVKRMMSAFTYEDSKLTYAKFAYDYCLDNNNYYKVNDAFEFETTIDELNEYIEHK